MRSNEQKRDKEMYAIIQINQTVLGAGETIEAAVADAAQYGFEIEFEPRTHKRPDCYPRS